MPSKQIEEVKLWWDKVASTRLNTIEEIRDFNEEWAKLTGEPGEFDYIETKINDMGAIWAIPHGCDTSKVLLAFHGGGFFVGSMYTHRKMFAHMAKRIGCRALIINYRLTPEHQHPDQVNDAVMAYQYLLNSGIKPQHIAFTGDSAGGGLSITSLVLARDKGLPMPAASMPLSAWFDMELIFESRKTNKDNDHAFGDHAFNDNMINQMIGWLLGENGNRKDPYVNPLYADLKGLPPIYMHVGEDEKLLDDSRMFLARAKAAGVDAKLDIFPNMQHTFQMAAGRAPEADESINRLVNWVKPKLGLQ